jgi:CRISPR-associated protein Cas8b1/Cst1 subtype I-B
VPSKIGHGNTLKASLEVRRGGKNGPGVNVTILKIVLTKMAKYCADLTNNTYYNFCKIYYIFLKNTTISAKYTTTISEKMLQFMKNVLQEYLNNCYNFCE